MPSIRRQFNLVKKWAIVFMPVLALASAGIWFAISANAAVPSPIITYQGKILVNGTAATSSLPMSFTIYDTLAIGTGNPLYTASGTTSSISEVSVTPSSGLFSVNLGDTSGSPITNALSSDIFKNNSTLYLEVIIDGQTLSPRKLITAAPYAINSTYAATSTFSETAGTSTYANNAGLAGTSTFSYLSSTSTFSDNSNLAIFANSAGSASTSITSTYAMTAGNADLFNNLATSSFGVLSRNDTVTGNWTFNGITSFATTTLNSVSYVWPSSSGSNGQVLTTNGSGSLSWTTVSGGSGSLPSGTDGQTLANFGGTWAATSGIYINSSTGYVGIGTAVPGAPLEVTGRVFQSGLGGSTYFGYGAGYSDDLTNNYNTAVGFAAMASSTSASGNVAIGAASLMYLTTGNYNTAVGYGALSHTVTGTNNIALGFNALSSNINGSHNTALGGMTLNHNTSGVYNIALGDASLYYNTIGTYNIAIGQEALYHGASSSDNIAIGKEAMRSNDTGLRNIAIGQSVLWNNVSGIYNIALGYEALYANTTGTYNIALGDLALYRNISGLGNLAMGSQALYNNTTGSINVAIGGNALFANTTGFANTANGTGALQHNSIGNYNTANGEDAGYSVYTGSYNTFIGAWSGSGYSVDTSSLQKTDVVNSISIGYDTYTTADNQVVIGNTAITQTLLRGNVGVGTTSTPSRLSVYGSAFLEGDNNYINFGSVTSSSGYGLRDNGGTIQFKNNGGAWVDIPTSTSGGSSLPSGADGEVLANFAGTWTGTSNIYINSSTGWIGIGTTTPVTQLDIVNPTLNYSYSGLDTGIMARISGNRDDSRLVLLEINNINSSSTAYSGIVATLGTDGSEGGGMYASRAANNARGVVRGLNFAPLSSARDIGFRVGAALSGLASAPNMIIQGSTGYIGINTSAPSALLTVAARSGSDTILQDWLDSSGNTLMSISSNTVTGLDPSYPSGGLIVNSGGYANFTVGNINSKGGWMTLQSGVEEGFNGTQNITGLALKDVDGNIGGELIYVGGETPWSALTLSNGSSTTTLFNNAFKFGITSTSPNGVFYVDSVGNINNGTWLANAISTAKGGTGQDTSAWTGFAYINNGTWTTSTVVTTESDPIWVASSSSYLTTSSAAANYLTIDNASSTYLKLTGGTLVGDLTVSSSLTITGTSTIYNLLPDMAGSNVNVSLYNLGASTSRWSNVWAQYVNVGTSTYSLSGDNGIFAINDQASGAGTNRLTLDSSGNLTITGNLTSANSGTSTFNTVSSTAVCIGGVCKTSWPSGGDSVKRIIYVDNVVGSDSGNGTLTSPYLHVSTALVAAGSPTPGDPVTIQLLSPGTYSESGGLTLKSNITIVGSSLSSNQVGSYGSTIALSGTSGYIDVNGVINSGFYNLNLTTVRGALVPSGGTNKITFNNVNISSSDLGYPYYFEYDNSDSQYYFINSTISSNNGYIVFIFGASNGHVYLYNTSVYGQAALTRADDHPEHLHYDDKSTFTGVTTQPDILSVKITHPVFGTTIEGASLTVTGTSTLHNVLPDMTSGTGNVALYNLGASTSRWSNVWAQYVNVGTSTYSLFGDNGTFAINDAASGGGTNRLVIGSTGYVGIGTTTPGYNLTVSGTAYTSGDLISAGILSITGSGTSTISNNLSISGNSSFATTTISNLCLGGTCNTSWPSSGDSIKKTLYVDAVGNDTTGNGTIVKPYATIGKAITMCTGGASYIIQLMSPGTYTLANSAIPSNVMINGPSTLAPMATAGVAPSFTDAAVITLSDNPSFTNTSNSGFSNVLIDTSAVGNGIQLWGTASVLVLNSYVYSTIDKPFYLAGGSSASLTLQNSIINRIGGTNAVYLPGGTNIRLINSRLSGLESSGTVTYDDQSSYGSIVSGSPTITKITHSIFGTDVSGSTLTVAGTSTLAYVSGTALSITGVSTFATGTFSGNVGIGTTTPTSKLSINGGTDWTLLDLYATNDDGNGTNAIIKNLSTNDLSFSTLQLYSGDTSHGGRFIGSRAGLASYGIANGLTLRAEAGQDIGLTAAPSFGSLSGPNLVVNGTTGYVGIGTSTPSTLLTVVGTSTLYNVLPAMAGGTGNMSLYNLGATDARWVNVWSQYVNVGTSTYSLLADSGTFVINSGASGAGTNRLVINSSGNVGINKSSPTQKLDVSGGISNLIDTNSGISQIATTSVGIQPFSIAVSGRYAYVANQGSNSISIVDISKPSAPVQIATTSVGSNPYSITVSGRYAYVANLGSNSISIVDISKPSAPVQIATAAVDSNPYSIAISGRYAYVAVGGSANSISVVDISNPSAPIQIATAAVENGPTSIAISGRYAYVVNQSSNSISVVDISKPSAPVQIATTSVGTQPYSIAVSGRYAYVANSGNNSISVVDISNALTPTEVATTSVGGNPLPIAVSGRYAYVANYQSGSVSVIDISNPTTPDEVAIISDSSAWAYSIAVSGRYAYVANSGNNTISVLDLKGTETSNLIAHSTEIGQLTVENDIIANGVIQANSSLSVGIGGILSNGALAITATNTASYFGGAVTIGGTTSTAYQFYVANTNGTAGYVKSDDGSWANTSDVRAKKNISTITNSLNAVMAMNPVYYDNIGVPTSSVTGTQIGFIAQEMEQILPQVVDTNPLTGMKAISYAKLTPILAAAIKEQQAQINALIMGFASSASSTLSKLTLDTSNVFSQKITFKNHVIFSEDSVGQAKILTGATSTYIGFKTDYDNLPVITATPLDFLTGNYRVVATSTLGFLIEVAQAQETDVMFNWHAFGADPLKIHSSDGTVQEVNIKLEPDGTMTIVDTTTTPTQGDNGTATPPIDNEQTAPTSTVSSTESNSDSTPSDNTSSDTPTAETPPPENPPTETPAVETPSAPADQTPPPANPPAENPPAEVPPAE